MSEYRTILRDFIAAAVATWRVYIEDMPARLDRWAWDYRERTGQAPDWKLWRRIQERER